MGLRSAWPGRVCLSTTLWRAYDNWSGERKRFQRCVPYSNGYALLEAIREGVNGRVMGGEWVEVVHE